MTIARRDFLKGTAAFAGVSALPALPASAALGSASAVPLQLAKVYVDRTTAHLIGGFDDTHRVFPEEGAVELLLWPGDLEKLAATGLRYDITVTDVAAWEAGLGGTRTVEAIQPGESPTGDYRTLAEFEADMRQLAADHPQRCRLITLPEQSREGRDVLGLEICTDPDRRDGRPVYYVDGIHHAREWPAAEFPLMLAFDLLESYGTDDRVTAIVDHVRTIIVPIMNPDGFHFARRDVVWAATGTTVPVGTNAPTGSQYWRKNRRADTEGVVLGDWNSDAYGVDPNRNHAFAWGGSGSSASTTSDTHRGDAPQSEPEVRNVAHVLKSNFVPAMITNHTSGELVLYAYSWTTDDLQDQALCEGIGRAMASLNGYTPQKSIDLYIHTGVCVDYGYGTHSSIAYTFEHCRSFHPSYTANIPDYYARNRDAYLLLAIEGCMAPEDRPAYDRPAELDEFGLGTGDLHHAIISGRVVDGEGNGVQASLRLSKAMETPLWFEGDGNNPTGQATYPEVIDVVIDTAADGTFTWHVNVSTRPHVRATGATEAYTLSVIHGGTETTVRDVTVDRGQRLTLDDITV